MENSDSWKLRLVFQRQHGDLGCWDHLDSEGQRTNLYVMKCFEAFGFEDPLTFSESEMLNLSIYIFSRINILFECLPWSWKSHIQLPDGPIYRVNLFLNAPFEALLSCEISLWCMRYYLIFTMFKEWPAHGTWSYGLFDKVVVVKGWTWWSWGSFPV